jgi:peptide/nickel transport system ATP-binding protein
MTDLLRVRDLHVSIALPELTIEAVRGIDFRVRQGSTVALVGESGAGKSIAARAIMGLLPRGGRITAGQILFRDPGGDVEDLARLDPDGNRMRAIRGRHISMVFQEPMSSFSPLHTIGDQIAEAFTVHHDSSDAVAETRTLLRRVGFADPAQAFDAYPFELSGGLRQRAMIAMALICRPALVIADEPTTALDVTTQAQILKLLCDLQRSLGMAVLIITHDLGVVANLAEEIVVLYRGEVVEAGVRDDIFGDPRHPYLKALLGAVPRIGLEPGVRLNPVHETAPPANGDPAPAPRPKRPPAVAPRPLLELRALRKSFRQRSGFLWRRHDRPFTAVDGVSLTIHQGETLGLVGESGSGKSTLAKLIMRATPPDSGKILFHQGARVIDALTLDRDGLADYRRRVQYIFQDPFAALDPRMTVQDIITEPLEIHRIGTRRARAEEARDLMRLVGLDPRFLNRYPHSFSGGQRQRVGIARALALRPELLICDEPVSALDVGIQAQILNLLRELQATLGLTYLFVSHNLAVVDYLADRIAVMCHGRIVELAPRQALFETPVHPYTRELLAVVPDTRLDRPLDFAQLADMHAADPAAWREPFREDGTRPLRLHEFGDGHFVRAAADVTAGELHA